MLWWKLRRLGSPDPARRVAAVEALRRDGGTDAGLHLVRALTDDVPEVRQAAASALSEIGSPEVADDCVAMLQTEDEAVARVAASMALGVLRHAPAVDVLLERVLRDDSAEVRAAAGDALARLGWRADSTAHRLQLALARGRFAEAAQLGPVAIAGLLSVLFETRWRVPDGLAAALGDLGLPALEALRAGPESHVRWDGFASDADRVRGAWRELYEQVVDRRMDVDPTRELALPSRSTITMAADLGAHLIDVRTGDAFAGGPNDQLGRFRTLAHECPFCGAPQATLGVDVVARECLSRPRLLGLCASCARFFAVPATIFAPGALASLSHNAHRLAHSLGELAYSQVLAPDWGIELFRANAEGPLDPTSHPWDGDDPCPVCRSTTATPAGRVTVPCSQCRASLLVKQKSLSRTGDTQLRCRRCDTFTVLPPTAWCQTCARGLLPDPILLRLVSPATARP